MAADANYGKFLKNMWKETIKFPWTTFKDPDVVKQFKLLSVLGTAILPEDKLKKVSIQFDLDFEISKSLNCFNFS